MITSSRSPGPERYKLSLCRETNCTRFWAAGSILLAPPRLLLFFRGATCVTISTWPGAWCSATFLNHGVAVFVVVVPQDISTETEPGPPSRLPYCVHTNGLGTVLPCSPCGGGYTGRFKILDSGPLRGFTNHATMVVKNLQRFKENADFLPKERIPEFY